MPNFIQDTEKTFWNPNLLSTKYFKKYRKKYCHRKDTGFPIGPRNYSNLLIYLNEISKYNEQHAKSFAKRIKSESMDWRNFEAIFCEIIIYRYYIRLVYEGLIKSIDLNVRECDLIIERLNGEKYYLEAFCIMPKNQISTPEKPVVKKNTTHKQLEMASVRQKLLGKIQKQQQFTKARENYAVIELNDVSIAGDFSILSSLSSGYKIITDRNTMKQVSEGYDWKESIFEDKSTQFLKGIIYFDLGDYESRKFIENPNFNQRQNKILMEGKIMIDETREDLKRNPTSYYVIGAILFGIVLGWLLFKN